MTLLTQESPPLNVPLGRTVTLKGLDRIEQRVIAIDDRSVGIIIDPTSGQKVRLVEA